MTLTNSVSSMICNFATFLSRYAVMIANLRTLDLVRRINMTQNQIAYAEVKLGERVADETKRHNEATEANNAKLAELEEVKLQITDRYNTSMVDLRKRELDLQDQWNTGKLTNEAVFNTIKYGLEQERNSIQKDYNDQMVLINQDSNAIKKDQQELDANLAALGREVDTLRANLSYKASQYEALSKIAVQTIRTEGDIYKAKISNPLAATLGLIDESLQLGRSFDIMNLADSIARKVDDDINTYHQLVPEGDTIPLTSTAAKEWQLENQNRSSGKNYYRGRPVQ